MDKLKQVILLITCVLLTVAVSIRRDGRLFGQDLSKLHSVDETIVSDTITTMPDGTVVVNTTALGKDIFGYGGQIPLEIHLKERKVVEVRVLEHSETPSFFDEVVHILSAWDGKTIEEAQSLEVDEVSGATYTSRAIIDNVHLGLDFASERMTSPSLWERLDTSPKAFAALLVVLLAGILPLFFRQKGYRLLQQLLNVSVLGFWCGTFLSYTVFINALSNGMNVWTSLAPIVMLLIAFLYPLFGKKNHYCNYVCPLGSLQDLAGKCSRRKWKLPSKAVKYLTWARECLWGLLMLSMLVSAGYAWVDYELFTAFVFRSAPLVVVLLAVLFILLSVFIPRPYCRFVCPTGTLFKLAQNTQ